LENEDKENELKAMNEMFLGKLHFKLKYNYEKRALCVTIIKCSDLPPKDPNFGSSDPYIKLQLLPEKQHKVRYEYCIWISIILVLDMKSYRYVYEYTCSV